MRTQTNPTAKASKEHQKIPFYYVESKKGNLGTRMRVIPEADRLR